MTLVYFLLIVNTLISAGTYIVAKGALFELSPMELGLARFVLASICYLPLLARSRWPSRRDLLGLCALGVLTVSVFQTFFLFGLSNSTSGRAALLFALTPVFVFLLARVRLGEPTTVNKAAGIAMAFTGVLAVLFSRGLLSFSTAARRGLQGDLLTLVAVVAWAAFVVFGKPYTERVGAIAATGWSTIAGMLAFAPIGIAHSDWHHFQSLSWSGWAAIAYLSIFASILNYVINYWAVARIDAGRVAIWTNLQPVLTAALSWAIYGERLTPAFLAGGCLVIGGVVLMQRPGTSTQSKMTGAPD
jgi:drug/metabolite transporter (DMT)-like permease